METRNIDNSLIVLHNRSIAALLLGTVGGWSCCSTMW